MKINITGDFFISKDIEMPNLLLKNILPFFENSDFNIVNLESPISDNVNELNKIKKVGPHLIGHYNTFEILKELNINLVTLANNHILDYGEKGLNDTFDKLAENGIQKVGAGKNIEEASKIYTLENNEAKIAIINFTENEWSIAKENKSGANPIDIIENTHQIHTAKNTHDIVICIIHGGNEYYHLPSPRMVKQYRFYAEQGADVIVGHHTHSVSGYEIYNNVPIFYSLGNFLFTMNSKNQGWYKGYILQLTVNKNKKISFEIYPTVQDKITSKIEILSGKEKEDRICEILGYNEIINDKRLLNESWITFIENNSDQYIDIFSPINFIENRYINAALKRLRINKLLVNKNNLKKVLNYIQCEAHYEAIKDILRKKIS